MDRWPVFAWNSGSSVCKTENCLNYLFKEKVVAFSSPAFVAQKIP